MCVCNAGRKNGSTQIHHAFTHLRKRIVSIIFNRKNQMFKSTIWLLNQLIEAYQRWNNCRYICQTYFLACLFHVLSFIFKEISWHVIDNSVFLRFTLYATQCTCIPNITHIRSATLTSLLQYSVIMSLSRDT